MFSRFFAWLVSWKVLRVVLWILHAVLVVAIVVGLWYVNDRYRLETDLLSPFPRLHPYWLPLLFVLIYLGAWLGYWFFKLLTDPRTGDYPDIDDAWTEGLAALDRAGIDAREVPLVLVIGSPRTGPADFFAATGLPFAVRGEPRRPDAPVSVYATREAVFVTCPGASALARFAGHLAAERPTPVVAAAPQSANLLDSAVVISGEPTAGSPASAPLSALDEWLPAPGAAGITSLPTDERDRCADRLRYLCRLIAARRQPYCAANGIVWLFPVAATASESIADQTALVARADALATETGLQVECPAIAVVCDAQDLTGFRDLLRGLPGDLARERLLGRSFPLVPAVAPGERPAVIAGGLDWVARHLVPGVVFQRFGSEAEGTGERWSVANARLWALTADLYDRRAALARLIAQSLTDGSTRPPMLAGTYLAGTGPDEQDRAFAAGVVQEVVRLQNHVAWSASAAAEEADYRRMTFIGYAATVVLVAAVIAFGYATWR